MKKLFMFIFLLASILIRAQKYEQTTSKISFLSDAPLEDIYAESKKSRCVFNATNKKIVVLMKPNTFVFKNPMMQEHFNESYMESDKYPKAILSGEVIGDFDVKKDGVYEVTVKGKLTIHGVEKNREIKGKIIVKEGKVSIDAKFAIKVADHGIKIPSMKIKNIAEVVEVTVAIDLMEKKS
ncbi:MAG: hypothetical protein CMD35_03640 [Flavobacteriales bacterium]|nr:hypothetical protein [Flavobacteriales bacterium]